MDALVEQWCSQAHLEPDSEVRYLAVLEVVTDATPIKRTSTRLQRAKQGVQTPLFGKP